MLIDINKFQHKHGMRRVYFWHWVSSLMGAEVNREIYRLRWQGSHCCCITCSLVYPGERHLTPALLPLEREPLGEHRFFFPSVLEGKSPLLGTGWRNLPVYGHPWTSPLGHKATPSNMAATCHKSNGLASVFTVYIVSQVARTCMQKRGTLCVET